MSFLNWLFLVSDDTLIAFLVQWFLGRRFLNIFLYISMLNFENDWGPSFGQGSRLVQKRIFYSYTSFCVNAWFFGGEVQKKKICLIYFYVKLWTSTGTLVWSWGHDFVYNLENIYTYISLYVYIGISGAMVLRRGRVLKMHTLFLLFCNYVFF